MDSADGGEGGADVCTDGTDKEALDAVTRHIEEGADVHVKQIRRPSREVVNSLVDEVRSSLAPSESHDRCDDQDDDWDK